MKKVFFLLCLLILLENLSAQEGAPLLTHFKESRDIENQSWAICQDVNRVMLFANRKGILSFDGEEWVSLRIPIIPYSIQINPVDSKIYVGGDNNYGFLDKDQLGVYSYVSLSGDSSDLGIITKIIVHDSILFFYGEQSISQYNVKSNKLMNRFKSKAGFPFTGVFSTPGNTFINVIDKGLFRLESDSLFPIVTGYLTERLDILFSLPYNQNMVLVGKSDGVLSLFDGIKYYDYHIKDDGYIRDNILSEGISIGDSLYAFSTLDGGAIVIEKFTGRIRYLINNQNELPDDEVFAIGTDCSGGLWLSHQYGLTRADLNLPVENFSIYPGLKGNLTASLKTNNELYVATSEGVFYLSEVKDYSEVEIMIKKEQKTSPVSSVAQPEQIQVQENSRKNIFTRIFGKKMVPKQDEKGPSSDTKISSSEVKPAVQYIRKKVSKLKSVNYIYKKVEGLNEKCRQLVSTQNGILTATNQGLYIINDHKASVIVSNRYINFITWQPFSGKYQVATGDGYFLVSYMNGKWRSEIPDPEFIAPLYSVVQEEENTLWLGGDNIALRADISKAQGKVTYEKFKIQNNFPQRYILNLINDSIFLLTETGEHFFSKSSGEFVPYKARVASPVSKSRLFTYPLSNVALIGYDDSWIYPELSKKIADKEISLLKIFDELVSVNVQSDNIWIIDGKNRIFSIDRKRYSKINPEIGLLVKSIYNEDGTNFSLNNIIFNRGDNLVNFDIISPSFLKQNTTQYQYFIDKLMTEWSPWSTRTSYSRIVPKSGEYVLLIRAKDLWGNIGEPVSLKFTIKAPFTKTTIFYVLIISFVLLIIFLIVRFRERQLYEKNRILEEKVKERTAEIEAQKEEITSSIEYASRIQRAMLPETYLFKESFSDFFIIFKPRDIVSGDFFWINEDAKNIYFTVGDCTGHGVPGAFMSTLGISTLHDIITNNSSLKANSVLNLLREKIKTSLHQTGKQGEAADGMDISFCILNKNRNTIQFSGAYSPIFIFTGEELKEYKSDRMPIGIHYGDENSFTNFEINIKRGDTIYIFSDGYTDQFGGPDDSKYKKSNLKKLLSDICHKPMDEQKKIVEDEFDKWKGEADQVDDVTIIGIRI